MCVFSSSSSASLLALGICQASGQIDINPDSLIGVETYRTRLVLENGPEDAQAYSWHRGANDTEENMIVSYNVTSDSQQNGPMFTGRESVLKTGDLHIRGSQLNDTGNYTVRVDAINGTQRATGWLKIQGESAGSPAAPTLCKHRWTWRFGE